MAASSSNFKYQKNTILNFSAGTIHSAKIHLNIQIKNFYKKIPKFTNENYLYLYELILWDEINERQSQRTIKTRKDLKEWLKYELPLYTSNNRKDKALDVITKMPKHYLRKYINRDNR